MDAPERRREMMKLISDKRHVKIEYLASAFGVSNRTVSRDLAKIAEVMPIYDQSGRHGGIYVTDNYRYSDVCFGVSETGLIQKLIADSEAGIPCRLSAGDVSILRGMLARYAHKTI